MLRATLSSAWWVVREPRVFLLSAAATIGFGFAIGAFGGVGGASPPLSSTAISAIVILVLARSWCGLAVAATALAVLRRGRHAPLIVGVPVMAAIGVLLVTVPPIAPLVVGAFLFVTGGLAIGVLGLILMAAGAFWIAAWSQAGMLLVDGRADLTGSGEASVLLTRGYRGEILGVWFVVGAGVAAATWLDGRAAAFLGASGPGPILAGLLHLALRVVTDAACTSTVAALYYELDKIDDPRV